MHKFLSSSVDGVRAIPGARRFVRGIRKWRDIACRSLATSARRPPVDPLVFKMNAVRGSRGSSTVPKQFVSEIPQAGVFENSLEAFVERDWRSYFSNKLSGVGLEIGALQRQLPTHEKMQVKYVDRFSVAKLREHYPELKDFPFIEPDYVCDAQLLQECPDNSQDFVIATYVFEHLRNPLLALKNWCRVVRPGGLIYFTVPDKRLGFDRSRVRTNIEHIILDYFQPSLARDFDHFLDYAIHVHHASGTSAIEEADRLAKMDYCIHFHVFIPSDVLRLISWLAENVCPVELLEGPCMSPRDEECHFLLRVLGERESDVSPGK